jgi:hypothetical protein
LAVGLAGAVVVGLGEADAVEGRRTPSWESPPYHGKALPRKSPTPEKPYPGKALADGTVF